MGEPGPAGLGLGRQQALALCLTPMEGLRNFYLEGLGTVARLDVLMDLFTESHILLSWGVGARGGERLNPSWTPPRHGHPW